MGGRIFPYDFWRRFAEIERVVAIKVAPFNRYATQDVLRGVIASGRSGEIASLPAMTITSSWICFRHSLIWQNRLHAWRLTKIDWAVWTQRAVVMQREIRALVAPGAEIDPKWLVRSGEVTDMNAAVFNVANHFHGCIAGIHEVLRRQGLMVGRWCLNPSEDLSLVRWKIDRVIAAYPHLVDDDFINENLGQWLS